jgi:adenine/guanine/hypoxanthine permease
MLKSVLKVAWSDPSESVPAFLALIGIPLTFSIANGLALGFVSYPVVKAAAGRAREVSPLVWVLALLFVVRYIYLGGE